MIYSRIGRCILYIRWLCNFKMVEVSGGESSFFVGLLMLDDKGDDVVNLEF